MIDVIGSSLVGNHLWFAFSLDLWLKSAALCLAELLIVALSGRRRILANSAVLHACLIGLMLLPLAVIALPKWTLAWTVPETAGPQTTEPETTERGTPRAEGGEPYAAPPAVETSATFAMQAPVESTRAATLAAPVALKKNEVIETISTPKSSFDWRAGVAALYVIVAASLLIRFSVSLAAVQRLRRAAAPLSDVEWRQPLAHWQQRLGIRRRIELLKSDQVSVPIVVGWRRPAIVAPARLASADAPTIDAILLHELAHVGRGDYGWNLLLRLLQAFYWPNPLIWLVGRSLSHVREQACDELCIHWLGGAEGYRATLVELAASLLGRPLTALGMAMARTSRLQRRMAQIDVSRGRAECQSRLSWRLAAMIVVGAMAGAIGALRTAGRAAAEPPTSPQIVNDNGEGRPDAEKPAPAARKEDVIEPSRKEPPKPAGPAAEGSEEKPRPENTKNEDESEVAQGESAPQAHPIKVRVEKVLREDFVVQTSQPGTLKASRTLELYAKVAGPVIVRNANVGDLVKTGDVLAEIDAPELEADLEQAKLLADEAPAAIEQAEGKLNEALAGLEGAKAEIAKSEVDVKQSTGRLEFAKKNQRLYEKANERVPGSNPEHVLGEKAAEVDAAVGAAEGAKAVLDAAKAGVKQAEAAVAVAKAGLRIAQLKSDAAQQRLKRRASLVGSRQIVSPVEGYVARQDAEPGSFAQLGGKPLFVVSATNVVVMQTDVPERDAVQVAVGQHARVWLDAERNAKPHDAKVSRVGYAIDPKTRTMPVEIELANPDGRLRPGMFGKATIDLETHPNVLTLPTRFEIRVFADPKGTTCFRVVDGRAVKTKFSFSMWHHPPQRIELKSGLKEGDVVISEVIGELKRPFQDGDRVEIVDSEEDESNEN
jgi:HlyD family secretion protein